MGDERSRAAGGADYGQMLNEIEHAVEVFEGIPAEQLRAELPEGRKNALADLTAVRDALSPPRPGPDGLMDRATGTRTAEHLEALRGAAESLTEKLHWETDAHAWDAALGGVDAGREALEKLDQAFGWNRTGARDAPAPEAPAGAVRTGDVADAVRAADEAWREEDGPMTGGRVPEAAHDAHRGVMRDLELLGADAAGDPVIDRATAGRLTDGLQTMETAAEAAAERLAEAEDREPADDRAGDRPGRAIGAMRYAADAAEHARNEIEWRFRREEGPERGAETPERTAPGAAAPDRGGAELATPARGGAAPATRTSGTAAERETARPSR